MTSMQPSSELENNRLAELEEAFELFNQTSIQLTSAYETLQVQVEDLQQKLEQSNLEKQKIYERLEQLLNILPAGVIVLDLDGFVVDMNPVAEDILGVDAKYRPWSEVVSNIFLTTNEAGFYLTHGQQAYQLSEAPLQLTVENEGSIVEGKILIIQDVTDARNLQLHIDRNQRLNSLGDMTASLAHQIRTPLASALLYISQLDSDNLDKEKRSKFVNKSVNSLRHLESLVKDMLQYAKGGKSFSQTIKVKDLMQALLQAVEPIVKDSASQIKVSTYNEELEIVGDIDALITALQNLVANAIDVVSTNAEIKLEIEEIKTKPETIDFRVIDKGPGIKKELIDKIYEPFYTSRAQGTGLGLAVVKAVAEAHSGKTWVVNTIDKGTVFTLRIPAKQIKEVK